MWTRRLLKQNATIAFRRNYWSCVGVSYIAMFLGGGAALGGYNYNFANTESGGDLFPSESSLRLSALPTQFLFIMGAAFLITLMVAIALALFVSNVIAVGCNRYFLENREHKTSVGQTFYAFQGGRYSSTVWVMFLRDLYIFGWTMLFIIPGIIKSYSYMLVPYILAEEGTVDKERVFELSSQMMHGHKWEAFVLHWSFIGWYFLSALSLGVVDIFYTNPYINATFAEFYSAVKAEAIQKGIVREGELLGVSVQEG